jgi:hypothetical protein
MYQNLSKSVKMSTKMDAVSTYIWTFTEVLFSWWLPSTQSPCCPGDRGAFRQRRLLRLVLGLGLGPLGR